MSKLKLYFLLYSTPTVVIQSYETDVAKEYVILGNDALMKCSIPSFVADSVSVMGWTNSEDELKLFTQENSSGNLRVNEEKQSDKISIWAASMSR